MNDIATSVAEPTRAVGRPYPLLASSGQFRRWFLARPADADAEPLVFRLRGAVNRTALEAALADVVSRHESLRTVLAEVYGELVQRVLPNARPVLEVRVVTPSALERELAAAARPGASRRGHPCARPCSRSTRTSTC